MEKEKNENGESNDFWNYKMNINETTKIDKERMNRDVSENNNWNKKTKTQRGEKQPNMYLMFNRNPICFLRTQYEELVRAFEYHLEGLDSEGLWYLYVNVSLARPWGKVVKDQAKEE